MDKRWPFLLLAVFLAVLYLWIGTRPRVPQVLTRVPDWFGHGLAYALLASSAGRGLPQVGWAGVTALSTAHGGLLEWLQRSVPGRTAELKDVLADLVGSLLGARLGIRRR